MKNIYYFPVFRLFFLAVMFLTACKGGGSGESPVAQVWSKKSDFGFDAEAYAVAVDTDYVYLAGYNETKEICDSYQCSQWRIQKRSVVDGSIVSQVTNTATSGWDFIGAMTLDGTSLYAVGIDENAGWRVEKRNLSDLALNSAFEGGAVYSTPTSTFPYDTAMAVARDDTHLYIAGYSEDDSENKIWRIEKRNIITGALETGFDDDGIVTSTTGSGNNIAMAIAVDPAHNALFVAGYEASGWRIEKRARDTGALISGFGTAGVVNSVAGSANAIAIDADYIYIAGHQTTGANTSLRIEKRSVSDGSPIDVATDGPDSGNDSLSAVALDSSNMYVAGYVKISEGDYGWHIEKRDPATLSLVPSFGTNGVLTGNFSDGDDTAWSIAVDSNYIYAAGFDSVPGHFQWRVEKILK